MAQEQSSTYQKVACLIPGLDSPHVKVSLGEILNPILVLLLCHRCVSVCEWLMLVMCRWLSHLSTNVCVNGWMQTSVVKSTLSGQRTTKVLHKYFLFTINVKVKHRQGPFFCTMNSFPLDTLRVGHLLITVLITLAPPSPAPAGCFPATGDAHVFLAASPKLG